MAVTLEEHFASRRVTLGRLPSAETRWTAFGSDDDAEVRTHAQQNTPGFFDVYGNALVFIPRVSLEIERVATDVWDVIVHYGSGTVEATQPAVQTIDTTGGTRRILNSLQTVNSYAPSGVTPPNFNGAIGVTPNGVEGADIVAPVYRFTIQHRVSRPNFTTAYRRTLFESTGKVNSAAWNGFNPHECLFLGAQGSMRGLDDWELVYSFAAAPNLSDLTIGDITGIAKAGWDYLWIRYRDEVDDTSQALVKKPTAVYVERVYEEASFALLGLPV